MSQLNTVTISTDEFLALKKFETAFMLLDENKKQVIFCDILYREYFVVDENEALEGMKKHIEESTIARNEAYQKYNKLYNMSVWQFIKFKMGW